MKRAKSKSPARPVTAGDGEGDAVLLESPKSLSVSEASTSSASRKKRKSPAGRKKSKSPAGRKKSKSPAGRKKSKSPAGRKKSKSPAGRKKSKSPAGRKKSKSPRGRKKSKSPKGREKAKPEPEPEPWRPRSDSQVPDYESIHVTESLLPLREDFFTVIDHLANDERLKNYTSEFVRLYERVAKAHSTKHEMAATVEEQALRVAESERTIARLMAQVERGSEEAGALRRQVEELRAEVDATRLRELDSKGMIDNLREEVDRYQEQMRHVVGPAAENVGSAEENEAMVDYERLKKKIIAEKQEMAELNQQLKKNLADMYHQQESLHRQTSAANLQVTNLSEKLAQATQDVLRETRLKEKLEEEMECLAVERAEHDAKEVELGNALRAAERNAALLQQAVREHRANGDRAAKESDALQQRVQEQRRVNDRLHAELDKVRQDYRDRAFEIARQEDTINKLRGEVNKARHGLDNVFGRLGVQLKRTRQVEEQRQELAVSVKAIGRDLDRSQREVDQEKREVADLQKARDLLVSKVVRGEESFKSAANHLLVSERHCRGLEAEVAQYAREAVKQRRLIAGLEQERELLHADKAELVKQVDILTEQLNHGQEDVLHCKRSLQQAETKLQAQVNLTEATVLQRNKFEKLYEEARTVQEDLRAQAQITCASEQQLKETLSMHELDAKRLSRALAKAESDKAALTRDVNGLQLRARQLEAVVSDQEKAEAVLKRSIADLERDRDALRRDLRGVHNERDIIGTQLVRRNDEIHLLLAKIGVLQAMLTSGEEEYIQRLDDIRLLKLEVRRLRQEKVLLQRDLGAGADLRRELYHLSKDLAFEKQRRAALESELKTPINLHRWRRLEASDPASLDLIHKVNLLQKRLLSQHSLLLAKERQLQDAEKLYLALRATMVKLPGPDVLLRLKKAQHALEHRARKIKSLFAELSMTEATVHDYRVDLNRTREELTDFKSMYFTAKKKLDSLGQPLPREQSVAKADKQGLSPATLPPIDVRVA